MPGLSVESLQALNDTPSRRCETCLHPVRRNYCRECDEYFEAGHMFLECGEHNTKHDTHRTY